MLNDQYSPRVDGEDDILDALKFAGFRTRPQTLYDDVGVGRGTGQHWLDRLTAAGWVNRTEDSLYELAHDPREMKEEELADLFIARAIQLTDREYATSAAVRVDHTQY